MASAALRLSVLPSAIALVVRFSSNKVLAVFSVTRPGPARLIFVCASLLVASASDASAVFGVAHGESSQAWGGANGGVETFSPECTSSCCRHGSFLTSVDQTLALGSLAMSIGEHLYC